MRGAWRRPRRAWARSPRPAWGTRLRGWKAGSSARAGEAVLAAVPSASPWLFLAVLVVVVAHVVHGPARPSLRLRALLRAFGPVGPLGAVGTVGAVSVGPG